MKYLKITLVSITVIAIAVIVALYGLAQGWGGAHRTAGNAITKSLPPQINAQKQSAQKKIQSALDTPSGKQILFGDFHVHTTFSVDAFFISLPMLQGLGAHPPADACDFARFCSNLDFWSINDHAEGISPANWMDTKRSIRQCDAVSGDKDNQDLVSFLGWEWTQAGNKPENHYGHKNVVMRNIAEDKAPTRPIASLPPRESAIGGVRNLATAGGPFQGALLALTAPDGDRSEYLEFNRFIREIGAVKDCPKNTHVRDMPADCFEATLTPKELFTKLDQWGLPSIVIPHGTSWGFYTPPGSTYDKQLLTNDPSRQTLIEVFSGHGNSEQYRNYRALRFDRKGKPICPAPHNGYLPSCWQAGEIIRKRCRAENTDPKICQQRAQQARQIYAENGVSGFLSVPGAKPKDWLNSGQCPDCLLPALIIVPEDRCNISSRSPISQRKQKTDSGWASSPPATITTPSPAPVIKNSPAMTQLKSPAPDGAALLLIPNSSEKNPYQNRCLSPKQPKAVPASCALRLSAMDLSSQPAGWSRFMPKRDRATRSGTR